MSYITFTIPDDNLAVEREYIDIMTDSVQLHNEIMDMKPLKLKSIVLRSVSSKIDKLLLEIDDMPIMEYREPVVQKVVLKPVSSDIDELLDEIAIMNPMSYIVDTVENTVDECPICYEQMFDCVKTCCGHTYCKTCYDKINTCAMCRTDLGKPVVEIVPTQEEIESLHRILEAVRSIVVFEIGDETAVRQATNIAIAYARSNYVNLNDIENTIETYLNSVDNYLDSE